MARCLVAGLVVIVGLLGLLGSERSAEAIVCAKPYHAATADGRCDWSCAQGTLPDPATGQCVCQEGLSEVGQDPSGRRICAAEPACTGPYRIRDTEGRCFWSCGPGTQPDPGSGECVCQAGTTESGTDQFGRRQCQAAESCAEPYRLRISDGECLWSCARGTRPDPASGECVCQDGLAERGLAERGRRICYAATDCPGPYRVKAADGRCEWSCGAGTSPHLASGQCRCDTGRRSAGTDEYGRRVCR